jgi:hypothetical protein
MGCVFSSVKACGSQPSAALTGLSSSETESEAPDVEKRARNNLQTPKRLSLGPLLVAAVEAVPPTPQDFLATGSKSHSESSTTWHL